MTRRTKRLWAIETDERDVSEAKMPPGWVEPLMGRLQMMLSHYLNYTADILESTQGTWVVGARLLVIFLQMFKRPTKAKKTQNKTKQMNMKRECLRRVRLQKKVAKPNSESLQGMCLIFQVVIYIAYSECSVWRKVSRGVKGSCEELEQTGNSSLNWEKKPSVFKKHVHFPNAPVV